MDKDYTYREYLESAMNLISDAIKNDSFDFTSKYAHLNLEVAKEYLDKALNKINPEDSSQLRVINWTLKTWYLGGGQWSASNL